MDDDFWSKYPEPPHREWLTPRVIAVIGGTLVFLAVAAKWRVFIADVFWMAQQ